MITLGSSGSQGGGDFEITSPLEDYFCYLRSVLNGFEDLLAF